MKQPRFQANKFLYSLLFPLLKEDGKLDTGPVAFKRYLPCGDETEYDVALCCRCGMPHPPDKIVYYPKDLLFVPGVYLPREFRRCTSEKHTYDWEHTPTCPFCQTPRPNKRPKNAQWTCPKHYYEANRTTCPHCGDSLSANVTFLWVRQAFAAVAGIPRQLQPVLRVLKREIEQ